MSITDTIYKLLAIAEDSAASPHERELAAHQAAKLMARHAITSLNLDTAHTEEITTSKIFVPGGHSTPSLAQAYGIAVVARAAGADSYHTDIRRWYGPGATPGVEVHIVGFKAELDTLVPLATSLIAQTAVAWTDWRRQSLDYQWMDPAERRRCRAGFVSGYAEGVAQRIRSSRQEAVQERDGSGDTSTALVLRTRKQRLDDHMDSLDLKAGSSVDLDSNAVQDGYVAGWSSGLGSPTGKTLDDRDPHLITQ